MSRYRAVRGLARHWSLPSAARWLDAVLSEVGLGTFTPDEARAMIRAAGRGTLPEVWIDWATIASVADDPWDREYEWEVETLYARMFVPVLVGEFETDIECYEATDAGLFQALQELQEYGSEVEQSPAETPADDARLLDLPRLEVRSQQPVAPARIGGGSPVHSPPRLPSVQTLQSAPSAPPSTALAA